MWQLRYKGLRDIVAEVIEMGSFVLSTRAGLTASHQVSVKLFK